MATEATNNLRSVLSQMGKAAENYESTEPLEDAEAPKGVTSTEAADPDSEPVATTHKPTDFASDKIVDLLNQQYTKEMFSSEKYKGMAAYMDDLGLKGFAAYFNKQAVDEAAHAMMFRNFVVDSLNKPFKMDSIDAISLSYANPAAVFEEQLAHEKEVSASIKIIGKVCFEEGNLFVIPFVQGMLVEQLEEEDRCYTDLLRVRMAGDGAGLVGMDRELGDIE